MKRYNTADDDNFSQVFFNVTVYEDHNYYINSTIISLGYDFLAQGSNRRRKD